MIPGMVQNTLKQELDASIIVVDRTDGHLSFISKMVQELPHVIVIQRINRLATGLQESFDLVWTTFLADNAHAPKLHFIFEFFQPIPVQKSVNARNRSTNAVIFSTA